MNQDTEKVKCRDVVVGDVISPTANRTCSHTVVNIEKGHKILGLLPARRFTMKMQNDDTWASNYGLGKPMRRVIK